VIGLMHVGLGGHPSHPKRYPHQPVQGDCQVIGVVTLSLKARCIVTRRRFRHIKVG